MSTLKTSNIQDTSGNNNSTPEEINKGRAKAWVNINQSGTDAKRDSFNVASISDEGDGKTTVTFTNAMPNANYAIVIGAAGTGSYTDWSRSQWYVQANVTTNGFRVENADETDTYYSTSGFSAVVFGD